MITPASKTVFIQLFPLEGERTSATGIVLTAQKEEDQKQDRGDVVVASEDAWVKSGDKVLFKNYGDAHEVEYNGEKYIVVKDDMIIATINE